MKDIFILSTAPSVIKIQNSIKKQALAKKKIIINKAKHLIH